jgi:hypothetical protein
MVDIVTLPAFVFISLIFPAFRHLGQLLKYDGGSLMCVLEIPELMLKPIF